MMTAALIIASGRRTHSEGFAPGRKVGAISAIKRIVLLLQKSGIREIVVCGEEEEVKKLIPSMNVVFLPCDSGDEMLCNIQRGIGYLQRKAKQILVTHVDTPLVSAQTLSRLLAAQGAVCIPAWHGKCGHPIVLRSDCFAQILEYRGENGLRGAIGAWGGERTIVEVEDPGILSRLPQGEKAVLLSNHDAGRLQLGWKFRIRREEIFYGPGAHQLLGLIEELHSLSDACRYMGISYSKGRKIIQTFEEQMNCTALITQQGGRGGGYSQLTDQARDMLLRYDAFLQDAEGTLDALFEKHFGDLG